jgi:nucleoside-diphosphate-sugar epimerase
MNIFIAGATGVLGRRVIPRLIKNGHHVIGLSRSDKNNELIKQLGGEPRTGELFNREQMVNLSSDCEAILHLATAIPRSAKPTADDWKLNDRIRREGTANLLEAAVKNNCRLYVQQSVTFLYGNRNGEWVDETASISDHQPPVLQSAFDMEKLVLNAVALHKLPAIILRFGSFYSYDSAQTSSMFNLISQGKFPVIGKGNAFWNIINVDDAAGSVVAAVQNFSQATGLLYNICDNEPVLYRDLVHYIASTLNAKKPSSIPTVLAKIVLVKGLVNFLLASVRCKNEKAKRELGWKPTYPTYREGVKAEVVKWQKR